MPHQLTITSILTLDASIDLWVRFHAARLDANRLWSMAMVNVSARLRGCGRRRPLRMSGADGIETPIAEAI